MQAEVILLFFAKFIESELGVVYADHNYFQLQNRLEEIAKLMGKAGLKELYEQGQQGITGQFRQLLLDVATNNETSFFRDPKVFNAIEMTVLPAFIAANKEKRPFRIWSAASSTGQEALSVAILLSERNSREESKLAFSILGSDVSDRVLQKAKSAQYSRLEVQRGLSNHLLMKYFEKDERDNWTAFQELRQHIVFKKLNLKEPFFFPEKFDLILCRNVLIYQSVEGKKEILKRVTETLAPGGFLILGSGESLLGLSDAFEHTNSEHAVIYRRKDPVLRVA